MSENKRDYEVGRGKPPVHGRFKKASPATRADRARKTCRRCFEALNEKVTVTIDGERREITKREPVATQLVNKSTGADLRATKMLIDTLKHAEKRPVWHNRPSPSRSTRRTRRSWRPSSRGNPGKKLLPDRSVVAPAKAGSRASD